MIGKVIQWFGSSAAVFLMVAGLCYVFDDLSWANSWEGLVVFGVGLVAFGIFEQNRTF